MSSDAVSVVAGEKDNREGLVPKLRFPGFADRPLHRTTLGKVTKENTTRNNSKLAANLIMGVSKEDGIVPMQPHLIADNVSRYKVVRKDWFAYNPMRLNIGSIGRWHGETDRLVSPDYVVFQCSERHDEPSLLPDYLDHLRRSKQWERFANEAGDGGVRKRIYYDDIAQLNLLLPDSDEQRKVADCLTSLDAVIGAEGERLAALRDHKKGLMQALFPAKGQSIPRLRFPEFRDAGEWGERTLAEVADMKAGKFIPAADISRVRGEGSFPCFGGNGLRGYTSTYTHTGKYPLIGRQGALCGNVNLASGSFYATEHAVVAKARNGVSVDWLYHLLVRFDLNRFKTGQAQPGLSVEVIDRMSCLVPSEIEEQQRIADCLTWLDELISVGVHRLAKLKVHKVALMQQLFPSPTEAAP